MKPQILAFAGIILILILVPIFGLFDGNVSGKVLRPFVTMYINQTYIDAELAETEKERQLGLALRPGILEDRGMLFLFDTDDMHGIWMKEMQFPIDILWLNEEFIVTGHEEGVPPESFPAVFVGDVPSRYVLEVNDGFAQKHDIKIGDVFYFSQFDADEAS